MSCATLRILVNGQWVDIEIKSDSLSYDLNGSDLTEVGGNSGNLSITGIELIPNENTPHYVLFSGEAEAISNIRGLPIPAYLNVGVTQFSGLFTLTNYSQIDNQYIGDFIGGGADFLAKLDKLCGLDLGAETYSIARVSQIINSNGNYQAASNNVYYPHIFYGFDNTTPIRGNMPTTMAEWETLNPILPAVYMLAIMNAVRTIAIDSGYTFESQFLATNYAKRVVHPTTKHPKNINRTGVQSAVLVSSTYSNALTGNFYIPAAVGTTQRYKINLKSFYFSSAFEYNEQGINTIQITAPLYPTSPNSNFANPFTRITIPATQSYDFSWQVTSRHPPYSQGVAYIRGIEIFRNGGSIFTNTTPFTPTNNSPYTVNNSIIQSIVLNAGDIIELFYVSFTPLNQTSKDGHIQSFNFTMKSENGLLRDRQFDVATCLNCESVVDYIAGLQAVWNLVFFVDSFNKKVIFDPMFQTTISSTAENAGAFYRNTTKLTDIVEIDCKSGIVDFDDEFEKANAYRFLFADDSSDPQVSGKELFAYTANFANIPINKTVRIENPLFAPTYSRGGYSYILPYRIEDAGADKSPKYEAQMRILYVQGQIPCTPPYQLVNGANSFNFYPSAVMVDDVNFKSWINYAPLYNDGGLILFFQQWLELMLKGYLVEYNVIIKKQNIDLRTLMEFENAIYVLEELSGVSLTDMEKEVTIKLRLK